MNFFPSFSKLILAVLCLAIATYLFCLPGSALPKNDWLTYIWFDKWVHIGIFTVNIFLWSRAFDLSGRGVVVLLIAAVMYGLLIEVVQDRLIANRSFDWADLAADFVGGVAGSWLWLRYKKRPL